MNIIIQTIDHSQQRYDTCGDWQFDEAGSLVISVSSLKNWRMEALIAIHELIEAVLCRGFNIDQGDVDQFDLQFHGEGEPGDQFAAPYYMQHQIATGVERLLAAYLMVDWLDYEKRVNGLGQTAKD